MADLDSPPRRVPPSELTLTDPSEEIVDNPAGWVADHIHEHVATGGRRGHRLSGWRASTLLLVTRGRRSGNLRRTALPHHRGRGARSLPKGYGYFLGQPENDMRRPTAFGMTGSGCSIAFADREQRFAFAYTHNRLVGGPEELAGRLVSEAHSGLGLATS